MNIDIKIEYIDINELLKPIDGFNPAGNYLKYENEYDEILTAIKGDNPDLKQGIWKRPLKKAEWKKAKDICVSTLNKKSKDLQIAAWLIQILLRDKGFKGLYEGCRLVLELLKKYWDVIYPLPEDDDMELRLTPFIWLDEKLTTHVKLASLIVDRKENYTYNYYKWEQDNLEKRNSKNNEEFLPEQEYLKNIFPEDYEFCKELKTNILLCKEILLEIKRFLNEKTSNLSPSFHEILTALDEIVVLNNMAIKSIEIYDKETNTNASDENEEEIISPLTAKESRIPETTDEAFRQLTEIVNFLCADEKTKNLGEVFNTILALKDRSLKKAVINHTSDTKIQKKVFTLLKLNNES